MPGPWNTVILGMLGCHSVARTIQRRLMRQLTPSGRGDEFQRTGEGSPIQLWRTAITQAVPSVPSSPFSEIVWSSLASVAQHCQLDTLLGTDTAKWAVWRSEKNRGNLLFL